MTPSSEPEKPKYNNVRTCAVTGERIIAGDRMVRADFGTYAVRASVAWTRELKAETERKLRESIPVISAAVALAADEIVEGVKEGVRRVRSRTAPVPNPDTDKQTDESPDS